MVRLGKSKGDIDWKALSVISILRPAGAWKFGLDKKRQTKSIGLPPAIRSAHITALDLPLDTINGGNRQYLLMNS